MPKLNAIQAFLQGFGLELTILRKTMADFAKGFLGIKDKQESVKPEPRFSPGTWFDVKGSFYQMADSTKRGDVLFDVTAKFNELVAKGLFEKNLATEGKNYHLVADQEARVLYIYRGSIVLGDVWLTVSGDEQGVLVKPGVGFNEHSVDRVVYATLRLVDQELTRLPKPLAPKKPAPVKQPTAVKVPKRRKGKVAQVSKRKENPDA